VNSRHQQVDHLICGACHSPTTLSLLESADRRFCLQCHTTMPDHNPEAECSTCHLLMTPDEAMQQIVNARTIPRGRE
jgi:predicted CXXCH cytochrome family protein